jgi:hypothetical protein|tara:strand:- start:123 stop:506 length:384 start_codon:yes stop_codon:yes gene_type:complete
METVALFIPFIFMGVVGYFIYRRFKKKGVFNNDGLSNNDVLWGKAVWGLYLTIPFILIFEEIIDDARGGNKNVLATVINFIATRFIVKKMIKNQVNLSYPKLITSGISLLVFFIQILIGSLIIPSLV